MIPTPLHKIFLSLLLAPLAGPIVYYLLLIFLNYKVLIWPDDYQTALLYVLIGTPGSYMVTILAGFPLYRYLSKRDRFSLAAAGICGGIIGGVVLLALNMTAVGSHAFGVTICTNNPLIVTGVGATVGGGVSCSFHILLGAKETKPQHCQNIQVWHDDT